MAFIETGRASNDRPPLDVAVIGTGIAGMATAWLLSERHRVTVYESAERVGGHANTVEIATPAGGIAVDTGFIVYNEATYPNLTALFRYLGVPTRKSDMSFAVSLDDGRLEYAGTGLRGLFAQKRNLLRPRFWGMLRDLLRFYRSAPRDLDRLEGSLDDYLRAGGYGAALRDDHLLPMAAAVWSCAPCDAGRQPAAAFIRFCDNHGLLRITGRPVWRTVCGGSREYVARLTERFAGRIHTSRPALAVERHGSGVRVVGTDGARTYDHVVLACHADQALALLGCQADGREREVLGAFRYTRNLAVLHTDVSLMPRRRGVWASWNYLGRSGDADARPCVTYWMNRLQRLDGAADFFVTLNPPRPPRPGTLLRTESYEHPVFDAAAIRAQRRLWTLQGDGGVWFCGAHFGAGFHEDALQAGLAVAEQLGGVRRPWNVANESGRICLGDVQDRHGPVRAGHPRRHDGATAGQVPGERNDTIHDDRDARHEESPDLGQRDRQGHGESGTRPAGSALYTGTVAHRRVRPKPHRLRYRVFSLLLDIDEIPALCARLRLFSHRRFNLFSFDERDHADGSGTSLRDWVEGHLAQADIDLEGGPIRLLAMPRVLGYGFNPISVWFCYRRDGGLAALLHEVHNTFGERHTYLIPVAATNSPTEITQSCAKTLHVSPFMAMDMHYDFRIHAPDTRLSLAILGSDADGPLIVAAFSARRRELSDAALLSAFIRTPLLTLKVIGGIHWEALRLWIKGIRLHVHPPAPEHPVSIAVPTDPTVA